MSAIISPCGRYRYRLERLIPSDGGHTFDTPETVAVIMVNPSTADADNDDATIRKLKGFGRKHGWAKVIVGNLFAYRATDVRELGKVNDPVGPDNMKHLTEIFAEADRIIFAWGPATKLPRQWRPQIGNVVKLASECVDFMPESIGQPAKDGQPRHPLMLSYNEPLMPWRG